MSGLYCPASPWPELAQLRAAGSPACLECVCVSAPAWLTGGGGKGRAGWAEAEAAAEKARRAADWYNKGVST